MISRTMMVFLALLAATGNTPAQARGEPRWLKELGEELPLKRGSHAARMFRKHAFQISGRKLRAGPLDQKTWSTYVCIPGYAPIEYVRVLNKVILSGSGEDGGHREVDPQRARIDPLVLDIRARAVKVPEWMKTRTVIRVGFSKVRDNLAQLRFDPGSDTAKTTITGRGLLDRFGPRNPSRFWEGVVTGLVRLDCKHLDFGRSGAYSDRCEVPMRTLRRDGRAELRVDVRVRTVPVTVIRPRALDRDSYTARVVANHTTLYESVARFDENRALIRIPRALLDSQMNPGGEPRIEIEGYEPFSCRSDHRPFVLEELKNPTARLRPVPEPPKKMTPVERPEEPARDRPVVPKPSGDPGSGIGITESHSPFLLSFRFPEAAVGRKYKLVIHARGRAPGLIEVDDAITGAEGHTIVTDPKFLRLLKGNRRFDLKLQIDGYAAAERRGITDLSRRLDVSGVKMLEEESALHLPVFEGVEPPAPDVPWFVLIIDHRRVPIPSAALRSRVVIHQTRIGAAVSRAVKEGVEGVQLNTYFVAADSGTGELGLVSTGVTSALPAGCRDHRDGVVSGLAALRHMVTVAADRTAPTSIMLIAPFTDDGDDEREEGVDALVKSFGSVGNGVAIRTVVVTTPPAPDGDDVRAVYPNPSILKVTKTRPESAELKEFVSGIVQAIADELSRKK